MVLEGREAHRGVGAQRRIERCAEGTAGRAPGCPLRRRIGERLEGAELRLLRDIAHRARLGARAEQRTLRSAQHLEAIEVKELQVRREQCDRNRRLIEIDANLLLDAWLVADDLTRADAADGHLALTGTEIGDRQAGDVARKVDDVAGAGIADLSLARRCHGERHVLQARLALLGRNDDLENDRLLRLLRTRYRRQQCDQAGSCDRYLVIHSQTSSGPSTLGLPLFSRRNGRSAASSCARLVHSGWAAVYTARRGSVS